MTKVNIFGLRAVWAFEHGALAQVVGSSVFVFVNVPNSCTYLGADYRVSGKRPPTLNEVHWPHILPRRLRGITQTLTNTPFTQGSTYEANMKQTSSDVW